VTLGRPLHEVVGWPGPMTYRQELAWQWWLGEDLNHPSRTDHYLMQVAAITAQAHAKDGARIRMDDFRLKFKPARSNAPRSPDVLAAEKSLFMGAFMGGAEKRTRTRAEAIALGCIPPDSLGGKDGD
jgi:hypothetical protein